MSDINLSTNKDQPSSAKGPPMNGWARPKLSARDIGGLSATSILLPALVCLWAIEKWRYRAPSGDSWFLAGNYMDACLSGNWLTALFTRLNEHWLVSCKAGLFASFQWFGRDADRLPILAWISIVAVVTGSFLLSKSWVLRRDKRQIVLIWFTAATLMFTLGQTYFLLWEACFFLHFPLIALLLMIWIFGSETHWVIRVFLASFFGAASVFTFGMGIISSIAILPVIWLNGRPDRVKATVSWIAVIGMLAALQFSGVRTVGSESTTLSRIFANPWQAVEFGLAMLGSPLACGTIIDPTLQSHLIAWAGLGIAAVLGLALWRRRHEPELIQRAAPWITIGLAGLGACGMVTAGRVSDNLGIAITGRYVALALPFHLGLFMLAALLWGQKRGFGQATVFLAALSVLNSYSGATEMPYWQARNRYERSSLMLLPHLPLEALPGLDLVEDTDRVRATVAFMREKDVLRRVPEINGVALTNFDVRSELVASRAEFQGLLPTEEGWQLVGRAELSTTGQPPDLILISFESEDMPARIIDTAVPTMPVNYFQNVTHRRTHRSFFNSWKRVLSKDRLAGQKGGWLRAWAWDLDAQRLFPIRGKHRIEPQSSSSPTENPTG